jgi:signal transduction histidine kinase
MSDADRKGVSDPPRQSDLRDLEPAPSGPRATGSNPGASWLERLLALSLILPIERGPRTVARAAIDSLALLLPGRAVGVCVADPDGEQIVEFVLPPEVGLDPGHDPSRLFAQLPYEHVLPLAGDLAGSTLHIAGAELPVLRTDDSEPEIVEYASRVISAGLKRAKSFADAIHANRELRRLQAQVIQAEKLASLGQIVAGVVHELNNPLTSIIAYSDYLEKRAAERGAAPEDLERLQRIGEAAQRILKFSRDLVAYARPASEAPSSVFLHEVIDKALVFCEHEFAENGIRIERRIADDLPPVRGIGGQLTQVFVNLFTNASHAMREGGCLLIEAEISELGDSVVVEVADDGVGISAEDLERIFEPFFTTKLEGRGTGLGLSIVRDIIDAHGGDLLAESTLGAGSTFMLKLPVVLPKKSTRPPPEPSSS